MGNPVRKVEAFGQTVRTQTTRRYILIVSFEPGRSRMVGYTDSYGTGRIRINRLRRKAFDAARKYGLFDLETGEMVF